TRLDNAVLDAHPAAALLATPDYRVGAPPNVSVDFTHPLGAYYNAGKWLLFNQDYLSPMPLDSGFDVLAPAVGAGSVVHVSSPGAYFDVGYGEASWYIVGPAGGIAIGDQFNVVVDPGQVFQCNDVIFADSYE